MRRPIVTGIAEDSVRLFETGRPDYSQNRPRKGNRLRPPTSLTGEQSSRL